MQIAAQLSVDYLQQWPLPALADNVDKNTRGHVLIIAGSREVPGAALLAATSALRAGAGKVTIATSATVSVQLALALPETRVIPLPELGSGGLRLAANAREIFTKKKFDAVLIGPGMQDEEATHALIKSLASLWISTPLILDACAINCVRELDAATAPRLITPHAGEMAHFYRISIDAVNAQSQSLAQELSAQWQCITALKGATTYVALPDGRSVIHEGGHCGLAMSGSGDCLAGIIAGLTARGATLEQACVWGIAIHGRAGEVLAQRYGGIGFLASEIPNEIPQLINAI